MKKNIIVKLFMLICLLFTNMVNAQNFYTCVPEDDWFNKQFDLKVLEEKFKVAKIHIDDNSFWEEMAEHTNKTSGNLDAGVYRVILKGGDGGHGGYIIEEGQVVVPGGLGGGGQILKKIFLVKKTTLFNATIGSKGKDGNPIFFRGMAGFGTDGIASTFDLENIHLKADYGRCGGPANVSSPGIWGFGYPSLANPYGIHRYDGYVKIYKYKG